MADARVVAALRDQTYLPDDLCGSRDPGRPGTEEERTERIGIMKANEFWLFVGSQFLYGEEVLITVDARGREMAEELGRELPFQVRYKGTAKTHEEVMSMIREANYEDSCIGVITFCHTFSPSKMWVNGLKELRKPYCHLATQYNLEIPDQEIDMDFMNLNQSAHGDREHGFIAARLRKPRKVIAGHWKDPKLRERLAEWMRTAVGIWTSRTLKVVRFGDNMREVAVTEGDKIEAQLKFGWQVNTRAVGDLVCEMEAVKEEEVEELTAVYKESYDVSTDRLDSVRYQAREEIAIKKILDREGAKAFSNTFQDLYGIKQLPGLATQHLMSLGYGFGAEGDWKTSAMTAILKSMGKDGCGASSFMEDYTYHLKEGEECVLGSHMLEVCPSVAADRPRIETHPLSIGMNEEDPARLVFEGKAGEAIVCTLIDLGGRFRLIAQEIEAIPPILPMPNLPVARVMWKLFPDLATGIENWIIAGGAHHSVLTYDVSATQLRDWAREMEIEFVLLGKATRPGELEDALWLRDRAYRLG